MLKTINDKPNIANIIDMTLEEFIEKNMKEDIGYRYAYSKKTIKNLDDYDESLEDKPSYTAVFGCDEFEEYATTLFIEDLDDFSAVLFVGAEDGLGNERYAESYYYYNEDKLLKKLVELYDTRKKWK